jgi:hypothetical protein
MMSLVGKKRDRFFPREMRLSWQQERLHQQSREKEQPGEKQEA